MTTRLPATVPDLLAGWLRTDPSRPAVTWLDPPSGARVELSRTTLANWVAKIGGLLQDVVGVERGTTVRLDLPTHWLGVAWSLACWSVGCVVLPANREGAPTDVVVVGDDRETPAADGLVVVGTAPLGGRSRIPVPPGALDAGAEVLGQPDDLIAYEPPDAATPATGGLDHTGLLAAATDRAESLGLRPGGRLATDLSPSSAAGLIETVLVPLVAGGSLVLVTAGGAETLASERPDVVAGTLRPTPTTG